MRGICSSCTMANSSESLRDRCFQAAWRGNFRDYSSGVDREDLEALHSVASEWGERGQHFYAGYALQEAVHCAWGDGGEVTLGVCVKQFQNSPLAAENADAHPLEQVAALREWSIMVGMNYSEFDRAEARAAVRVIEEELAQRLVQLVDDESGPDAASGFLVRGFELSADFEGGWIPKFPQYEGTGDWTRGGTGGGLVFGIPSAFHYFVRVGDYAAAESIARRNPDALVSHGLRGWAMAVGGLLRTEEAVERFAQAADEFAQDVFVEGQVQQVVGIPGTLIYGRIFSCTLPGGGDRANT